METATVIIPVFNVAKYIDAALESLSAQTVRNWRAVCVDDGSTDGSGAILDEWAKRDSRFFVVHQENRGVSAARNAALDLADGDVVAFLDPDDTVSPLWLENLLEGISGVDLVWGGMTKDVSGECSYEGPADAGSVYRGGDVRKRIWRAVFGYRLRDLRHWFFSGGMWKRCGREFGVVLCRAVRRSAIGDLRFDGRVRFAEDAFFLSALAKRIGSMRIIGDTGYRYFIRKTGAAATELRERRIEYKFAARDIRREIDPMMTHWRGSFLLSAADILRRSGLTTFLRYVTFRGFKSEKPD